MPKRISDPEAHFWSKTIRKENGCLEWTGLSGENGYGHTRWLGKMTRVHRISFQLMRGAIPDGLLVLHACDNTKCVEPYHLFVGTQAQNMADRNAKGRQAKLAGSRNGMSKLTENDVVEIRRLAKSGIIHREIADMWGMSRIRIGLIVRGQAWKSVG